MSATIGTSTWRTMSFSASADSWSGQDTRTMSAPARAKACTCSTVALTSLVTVLVIDCTVIGASPPTGTLPTWIMRQVRRWMSRYGRTLIVTLAKLALRLIERFRGGKKTVLPANRGSGKQRLGVERDIAAQRANAAEGRRRLAVDGDRESAGVAGAQQQPGARHPVGFPHPEHPREDNRLIF